jgi:oxygen-independent coproporphyrinogen-3 oxidase
MTDRDKIVRQMINEVMCNYYVDVNVVAKDFGITTKNVYEAVEFSISKFKEFINDGLMDIQEHEIKVNETGRLVIRNIAMKFDPLLTKVMGSYSKTI